MKKAAKPIQVIDNSIHILRTDRSIKGVEMWRQAMLSAENLINPTRKNLYDLYADAVLDTHLSSVLEKRQLSILNTELHLIGTDGKEIEEVETLIQSHFFQQILLHILNSKFYGYSLIGIDLLNKQVSLVPRAHVKPRNQVVVPYPYDMEGINYTLPPYSNIYAGVGDAEDLGLLLKASLYTIYKKNDTADWATYLELFGMPTRVGYYDPNMPQTRLEMENALKTAGSAPWITLPVGSSIEHPEIKGGGGTGNDIFERFATFCNNEISKVILGETMTTEVGKNGSRAQAEVHQDGLMRLSRADRKFVEFVLNESIMPILQAQGFSHQGAFAFSEDEEQISVKDRLEMDLRIHTTVAPIEARYFQETYNVPLAKVVTKPKEETKPKGQPTQQPGKTKSKKDLLHKFFDFFD